MTPYSFKMIIISFLVSWLCGFMLPGVPGGMGVREAMLILMLGNILRYGYSVAGCRDAAVHVNFRGCVCMVGCDVYRKTQEK